VHVARRVAFLADLVELAGGSPGWGVGPPAGPEVEVLTSLAEPLEVTSCGGEIGGHAGWADPVECGQLVDEACSPGRGVFGFHPHGRIDTGAGNSADPLLVAVVRPVVGDVLDGLVELLGDGVHDGHVARQGHGDVGQFSTAAFGQIVGAVRGVTVVALHGQGVAVIEVVPVGLGACQGDPAAFVAQHRERPGAR
jgi:hypothetical protein